MMILSWGRVASQTGRCRGVTGFLHFLHALHGQTNMNKLMNTILEKASKTKCLLIAGIALFALFQAASGFLSDSRFGYDLSLRHNEVCCAHQGVNSFRIWNHEATLPGFYPYPSDKPTLPHAETDVPVHAYPPWHTAMFYFYGWMSGSA